MFDRWITHAHSIVGEVDEDADVEELEDDADAINGGDEGAGVHGGEAVEHPEHAIEERHEVGFGRELLHRSPPPYLRDRRPTYTKKSNTHAHIEFNQHDRLPNSPSASGSFDSGRFGAKRLQGAEEQGDGDQVAWGGMDIDQEPRRVSGGESERERELGLGLGFRSRRGRTDDADDIVGGDHLDVVGGDHRLLLELTIEESRERK